MRIRELLKKEGIALGVKVDSKDAAIDYLIDLHAKSGNITDKAEFKKGILAREESGSTGVGEGIAIPHSKNAAVKQPGLAAMTVPDGVDYDSLDGQPANLFFMIAAPEKGADVHLEVLSRLSMLLMDENFRAELLAAKNADQFLDICSKYEMEKFADELGEATEDKKENAPEKTGYRVLAVTACPTGIAHTFMAAEALEKKGNEMGITIKVETNGSGGVKNRLTAKEIEECDGIIVAADKNVETARFDGKPVLFTKVADGIHKPEELINKVIDGKVSVHHESGKKAEEESAGGVGSQIYKHLMSGVSHMLPFVIGGGIMIALSFLIDQFMGIPKSSLSHLGNYHEIAAIFNQVGNAAFGFMIPVFAAYIAYSIAEKPGLVAGFVAGSMATTGLAFNKVAFFEFGEKASQASLTGIPSGFLGALAGGFLAGGVILVLKKALAFVPRSLEGIKSILLYPLLGVLVTGFLMLFVNIPMAAINTALYNFLGNLSGGSAVLLGLIVGGMMAIDMGGPFNKAAYVFGTSTLTAAALAKGGSVVMASVMAGGMVPPLAVFVATLLFKNKFTQEEHDAGLTNIVMGLSFITEGAIPFGAGDPARAIPSFIVGSAVTGALVGLSGIKLMAPHGGIFVIALTSNPLLYLLYIAVGAVIAGILFGSLRKVR